MFENSNNPQFLDFEVVIDPGNNLDYPVRVLRSPGGEAKATMHFPFANLVLENRLKDVNIAILRSNRNFRRVSSTDEIAVQQFGTALFDAVMTGPVRVCFDVSLHDASFQGKGLRLKLRVNAPELASLPWEFLYNSSRREYLALSNKTPLVRYVELEQPIQPLKIAPPIRILGMVASPENLERLDVEKEKVRIEKALAALIANNQVHLTWLAGQTWRDLQQALWHGPWHIFHFIGHGTHDSLKDEGYVAFSNDNGEARLLSATSLGNLLANHSSMRLVVLNSCEGASGSKVDLFSSTAATLVSRGIPAVLAMQYEITDSAAVEFSQTFYAALSIGYPVDAALSEARVAIATSISNTFEWGTPVLYMRSQDGVIFNINPNLAGPVVKPPIIVPPVGQPREDPVPEKPLLEDLTRGETGTDKPQGTPSGDTKPKPEQVPEDEPRVNQRPKKSETANLIQILIGSGLAAFLKALIQRLFPRDQAAKTPAGSAINNPPDPETPIKKKEITEREGEGPGFLSSAQFRSQPNQKFSERGTPREHGIPQTAPQHGRNFKPENVSEPVKSQITVQPQPPKAKPGKPITRRRGSRWSPIVGGTFVVILVVVLAVVLFVLNNGTPGDGQIPPGFEAAIGCKNVAVLIPEAEGTTAKWAQVDRSIFDTAIKKALPDATVQFYNATYDPDYQNSQADIALNNGACIMVVGAVESNRASTIVQKAKARKVPVISYGQLIQDKDIVFYESFDNKKTGELQGQYIADNHHKGDQVVMVNGAETDSNAILLKEGALSKLKPFFDSGDLTLVYDKFTSAWDSQTAQNEVSEALTQNNNNIQIAYVANDDMANSVIQALKAQNLNGKTLVTGQDATVTGIRNILLGDQAMTVYKPAPKEADYIAKLVAALSNNNIPSGLVTGSTTLKSGGSVMSVIEDPVLVTLDNLAQTVLADNYLPRADVCDGLPGSNLSTQAAAIVKNYCP